MPHQSLLKSRHRHCQRSQPVDLDDHPTLIQCPRDKAEPLWFADLDPAGGADPLGNGREKLLNPWLVGARLHRARATCLAQPS
mgnify:CR=1 FL=1